MLQHVRMFAVLELEREIGEKRQKNKGREGWM